MRYIELFAGVGGFRYGIEAVGCVQQDVDKSDNGKNAKNKRGVLNRRKFTCVYANEWDKYAASVYRRHYGEKEIDTRDITTILAEEIPDHDLLVGGFPCTAFSIAGKRQGFEDTRGTLFFEVARILQEKRPRFAVLENVKGLLSHAKGKTFQRILGVLSDIGYRVEWEILNSKHHRVPQNRERIFIVGYLGKGCSRKIFPLGENGAKDNGVQGQCANTITARYEGAQATGSYIVEGEQYAQEEAGLIEEGLSKGVGDTETEMSVLGYTRDDEGKTKNRHKKDIFGTIKACPGLNQQDLVEVTKGKSQAERVYNPDGVSATLSSEGGGLGAKTGLYMVQRGHGFNNGGEHELPCLRGSSYQQNDFLVGKRIRRLTPVECERLQGFSDSWSAKGVVDGVEVDISDTQRYKMMGNAVTTTVIMAIMEKLVKVYGIK